MTVLRDLVVETKDGEWGDSEASADTVAMRVVRGTDFEDFRVGKAEDLPVRHILKRYADRKSLQADDIIIETAGGSKDRPTGRTVLVTAARLANVDAPLVPASFARFLRLDHQVVHPAFMFWKLQAMYCDRTLLKYHTQHTGVARFQFTTFADNEHFDLPDRPTQKRIAALLGAYDNLIENNTRRIAILEEVARRIFEEWFVHFRAPGCEGLPLVDTKLGPIPKGWRVGSIGDIAQYVNRGIPPKYSETGPSIVINQKCVRGGALSLEAARRQEKPVPKEKLIQAFDVLINSTGVGTLGRVAQVIDTPDNWTVDSHLTIVRASLDEDRTYFGIALLHLESKFTSLGVGSTGQTELQRDRIRAEPYLQPPATLQREFGRVVEPMRVMSRALARQNDNLRAQRDLLLPKLISGEINLSEPAALSEAAE